MDSTVTQRLSAHLAPKVPTDAELIAAGEALARLDAEARALGPTAPAAPLHYAMGRIYGEELGDLRSAAVCHQNAFLLDPEHRLNLEAARRLFARAGQQEKALALHRREEALLADAAPRAESMRAQALLLQSLGRDGEAKQRLREALALSPEHPALLRASVEAARRAGDRAEAARLLLRSASATRDPVYKAQLLRRAVLLIEELLAEPEPSVEAGATELASLHEEATRKLFQADGNDQVGFHGMLVRARSSNDWEAVLRLCRQRAERTGSAADRALVAAIAAYRLARISEGLAAVNAALENHRRDPALLALRSELAEQQKSSDLAELLRQRAEGAIEPSERAHLKSRAALLLEDALEREQLLSEALAENPADAAAIALHARLVAQRDPASAAERFVALGETLEGHSPTEAAAHLLEAGSWHERSGDREQAAGLAQRALRLVPRHPGALRLLSRTLPALGRGNELANLFEDAASKLPRATGAELLARAAAMTWDSDPQRSSALAQRGAELARGLSSPRWLEMWTLFAVRAGDLAQLSQALEARADSTQGADAADLLLEASELVRAIGDEERSTTLLRKARGVEPESPAPRNALLLLPTLPAAERIELLQEEARHTHPARAAALHAERAVVLELEGRLDEAVQACAEALAVAGVDLAVLRRLARLQLRRGDHGAALAVLTQIAEAVPEGHARAEAQERAAEVAEWRVGDPRRAIELYRAATAAHPQAAFAWAQLARLLAWTGRSAEAAEAYEQLAACAQATSERNEARRWAASLYAHRAGQPAKAAALLRSLLADAAGDLEATAELLSLIGEEDGPDSRRERADLRGRLASRCQDPRVAAFLRAESAEERLAAGEREQAIAEYRRALALNPQDRVALDRVEEALRSGGQKELLAEHLGFRCAFVDGRTRAGLALQQAELLAASGRAQEAGAAYRLALSSDPDSLPAVLGARKAAEAAGDRQEAMRLLAREAELHRHGGDASTAMVEAALLANDPGEPADGAHHLSAALEADPGKAGVAQRLRELLGEDAPRTLASIYERAGTAHADLAIAARAWTLAGSIHLHELNDPTSAFAATGRALERDPRCAPALELRADAAEVDGRAADAAEALQRRIDLGTTGEHGENLTLRLGRIYAELGDAEKALPILGDAIDTLPPEVLLALAPGGKSLRPDHAVQLFQRIVETFSEAQEPAPGLEFVAECAADLGRAHLALGQPDEAFGAFRRALSFHPTHRASLRHVAEISAQRAPEAAIEAQRTLLTLQPISADPLHALFALFQATERTDAAFCAAAALVGVGAATQEQKALYDAVVAKPPPAELPRVADSEAVHSELDAGAARELLAAASPELARALPTDVSGGRGALVRGDNPVRRVVAAIARALEMPEPQLYLARREPGIVAPVAGDAPGILVGSEVPKRYTPRQQRFLYARALAHLRRGTQAVAEFDPDRLSEIVTSLCRLAAPEGTDFSRLAPEDARITEAIAARLGQAARERLAPLAARAALEDADPYALALGIRESAERAAMAICADPAAALSLVGNECPGGLERFEVATLLRFAVGEQHFALRR